jgi:REP element-mobilizing transposase RayT
MNYYLLTHPGRKSYRKPYWDYGAHGLYFVTLGTKGRAQYFGSIENSKLITTTIGDYTTKCWEAIPDHHPFIELDAFILMPDHLHGILRINNCKPPSRQKNQFGPQYENLGQAIRGFKSAVKAYAIKNNIDFQWHTRYYDRIIHDEQGLFRVRHYIQANPANWGKKRSRRK